MEEYDYEIREIGNDFVFHLHDSKNYKEEWTRKDITNYFNEYIRQSGSEYRKYLFSRVLYQLSRFQPRMLWVRHGEIVLFFTKETEELYRKRLLKRTDQRNVGISVDSENCNCDEISQFHIICNMHNKANRAQVRLIITNNGRYKVTLLKWTSFPSSIRAHHEDEPIEETTLARRQSYSVDIISDTTIDTVQIIFEFEGVLDGDYFSLSRKIDFQIGGRRLGPGGGVPVIQGVKIDRGVGQGSLNGLKMVLALPHKGAPLSLRRAYERGVFRQHGAAIKNAYERQQLALVENDLNFSEYNEKFSILLHFEELKYENDIKKYETTSTFGRDGPYLTLEVPGLAEKRPSVLRDDRVFARETAYGPKYEGYVHEVKESEICIRFHEDFHKQFIPGMEFRVEFTFSRHPLKAMHRAVKLIREQDEEDLVFPVQDPRDRIAPIIDIVRFLNRNIESNPEQRDAVRNIVSGHTSKVYIIYGPPGTGKTVTLVESILQTVRKDRTSHVLVSAPSNGACDLLTERLLANINRYEILRMHAPSRKFEFEFSDTIPECVREVSNYDAGAGDFRFPEIESLQRYRIIVCTLITAARLASAEFPDDHFKTIFIDEAGQAMEPECMVALGGVLANDGKVVLAGDPKQLGPIVRSATARRHGLQVSFLERLMDRNLLYKKRIYGSYDPFCITKLLKNYRSHEAIIKISNERFYEDELEVKADEMMRGSLCHWEGLPKRNFPVIFHGVDGDDQREKGSPSFFNVSEIHAVKKYVDDLLAARPGRRIEAKDIGIITPYRKQVEKIRRAVVHQEGTARGRKLGKKRWEANKPDNVVSDRSKLKVGTVEEFQGQERLVIIISTVRSSAVHLEHDARFHLGFLCDPKRFNVALTRAKALLIIVGNPNILSLDENWKHLIDYCIEKGGYCGTRPAVRVPENFVNGGNESDSDLSDDDYLPGPVNQIPDGGNESDSDSNDEDYTPPDWRLDR